MKDRILKTGAALALILTLVASVLPLGALAEGGTLYITGYTVEDSSGKGAGSITKGSVVNITVSVKDTSDGTGGADPKALDITKLDDSFSGGSVQVDKTSPEGRPLVYAVKFSNIKYKGAGQSLRFRSAGRGARQLPDHGGHHHRGRGLRSLRQYASPGTRGPARSPSLPPWWSSTAARWKSPLRPGRRWI